MFVSISETEGSASEEVHVVIRMRRTHQVKFIGIPENTSHMLEPLDQSTFGYLKKDLKKIQACINLIHSNPNDSTYQLDPLTLAQMFVK